MTDTMGIKEKIEASKIPKASIAKGINMSRGTFNNKMNGNNNARFSIGEEEQIIAFIEKTFQEFKNQE